MELRHLRSFLAVADRLGFSRAAEDLHLTQPALSRQIRDLEEELGCRLFDRHPAGVALTADGRLLQERAGALLRDADGIVREMQARSARQPSVLKLAHFGTFISLHLAPFIHRLHDRHPHWRVAMLELTPAEALKGLQRGDLDAVVAGRPEPGRFPDFPSRVIWTPGLRMVLPADHDLAKRRSLRVRDLADQRFVIWDEDRFPGFASPFLKSCRAAGFEPQVERTVEDVASMITAVARDRAVGYVGDLAGRLPSPGVVMVPLAEGEVDMPTLLYWGEGAPGASLLAELADDLAAGPAGSS